jgi:hypothetical protein
MPSHSAGQHKQGSYSQNCQGLIFIRTLQCSLRCQCHWGSCCKINNAPSPVSSEMAGIKYRSSKIGVLWQVDPTLQLPYLGLPVYRMLTAEKSPHRRCFPPPKREAPGAPGLPKTSAAIRHITQPGEPLDFLRLNH